MHFSSRISTQTELTSCSGIHVFHAILVYWVLHRFPVAAITNYHNLGGFEQQNSILSRLWRTQAGSQAVRRTTPPPRGSGPAALTLFFQLLVAAGIRGLVSPSP